MKAIVYNAYGSPSVLSLEDIPKPIPNDDEVLVKVHAVSVHSWDWDMLTGRPLEYRLISGFLKPKSNKLHGCDITGQVEAAGSSVKHLKVGDEVFGDLSEGGWGAFAEIVCACENQLILKPPTMTYIEAACLSHGGQSCSTRSY